MSPQLLRQSKIVTIELLFPQWPLNKQLMGLAVYNSIILDLNFPLCCFKKLLFLDEVESTHNSKNAFCPLLLQEHSTCTSISSRSTEMQRFSLDDLAAVMPVSFA